MTKADEASQIIFVDRYLEERIKIDYWWMDAGWYPCGGDWGKTGTWEVDKTRFPTACEQSATRPRQRHQDHRLVRARAGRAGHMAYDNHRRLAAGRNAAEPGQSRGPRWLTEHIGNTLPSKESTSTARITTSTRSVLAQQRRAGSPGHHRKQVRDRIPRLLGRPRSRHPEHADRFVRQRRPPQRPGDDAASRPAAAQRLHLRAHRTAGPHLRTGWVGESEDLSLE